MLNKSFLLSTLGLAILLPAAFASPITNEMSTMIAVGGSGFIGTLVADTGSLPFVTSAFVHGTLEQQVYQEMGGTLDFYYLVSNSSSSTDSISRMTTNNFTGFTTDVSFLASGGTPPSSADRSAGGDTVGFNFMGDNGPYLAPGTSSDWLEISTNATAFALTGTSNVLDGGTGAVITYSPVATPEPMSMSLLGAGLASFGLLGLRRRFAKK